MGLPQSEPYARDAFWAAILEFTNIDAAGLAKILAPNSGVKWRQWTGQRDEWLAWMYGKMLYVVEKIARQEGWHVDLDSLISNKPKHDGKIVDYYTTIWMPAVAQVHASTSACATLDAAPIPGLKAVLKFHKDLSAATPNGSTTKFGAKPAVKRIIKGKNGKKNKTTNGRKR